MKRRNNMKKVLEREKKGNYKNGNDWKYKNKKRK